MEGQPLNQYIHNIPMEESFQLHIIGNNFFSLIVSLYEYEKKITFIGLQNESVHLYSFFKMSIWKILVTSMFTIYIYIYVLVLFTRQEVETQLQ